MASHPFPRKQWNQNGYTYVYANFPSGVFFFAHSNKAQPYTRTVVTFFYHRVNASVVRACVGSTYKKKKKMLVLNCVFMYTNTVTRNGVCVQSKARAYVICIIGKSASATARVCVHESFIYGQCHRNRW